MSDNRARRKAMAVDRPPETRIVIGDQTDDFYLARIAELEEEIRALRAELAAREAAALFGVGGGPGEPPPVTADGTRGMQRGVSVGQSRPARGAGAKR